MVGGRAVLIDIEGMTMGNRGFSPFQARRGDKLSARTLQLDAGEVALTGADRTSRSTSGVSAQTTGSRGQRAGWYRKKGFFVVAKATP